MKMTLDIINKRRLQTCQFKRQVFYFLPVDFLTNFANLNAEITKMREKIASKESFIKVPITASDS